MNVTLQRRCLAIAAGSLFAGAVAVGAWSMMDVSVLVANLGSESEPVEAENSPTTSNPQVADTFDENLLKTSLRGPLFDPPPPPPVAPPSVAPRRQTPKPRPVVAAPKLELTLVGTLIENGRGLAILEDAANKFDVKGAGETLELSPAGVTVKHVSADQVTLVYQGRETTHELTKSKSKKAANDSAGKRNRGRNNR